MLIYDIFPPQKQRKEGKKVKTITLTLILFLSLLIVGITFSYFSQGIIKETKAQNHPFAGGSGTPDDPYQIANVHQLQAVKDYLISHFILINDIDASSTINWNDGQGFFPLGHDWGDRFQGTFDGKGYKISNLYINRPDMDNVGLFGFVGERGMIKYDKECRSRKCKYYC